MEDLTGVGPNEHKRAMAYRSQPGKKKDKSPPKQISRKSQGLSVGLCVPVDDARYGGGGALASIPKSCSRAREEEKKQQRFFHLASNGIGHEHVQRVLTAKLKNKLARGTHNTQRVQSIVRVPPPLILPPVPREHR